jgi:hypothetical protein
MITCLAGQSAELAIEGDRGDVNPVPADMFETVDSLIPSNWVVAIEDGHLQIGPSAWLRPDFWLDFCGSDSSTRERTLSARDGYRREREIIVRESLGTRGPLGGAD